MRYRTIPGTGLAVSEIGFGCGGNAGLMVRGGAASQTGAVARALELGITYFDTAPDYGDGAAERALGRALREVGAPAVVTTKVEVRRENLADVAGHVVRSARDSLRRLGLPRIDVLQIHNGPTPARPDMQGGDYHRLWVGDFLGPNGAAEGLRRLLDEGSIGAAGLVSRGGDAAEVGQVLETGLFRLVNLSYSLLDPGAGDPAGVLALLPRHGCGAAVFSPLAGGLLAGDGPAHALARPIDPASRRTRDRLALADRLGFLAESGGMVQAAYRFVLAHPSVSTVLGGFSSREQVEQVAAVSGMAPMSADLLERVRQAWAGGPGGAEDLVSRTLEPDRK